MSFLASFGDDLSSVISNERADWEIWADATHERISLLSRPENPPERRRASTFGIEMTTLIAGFGDKIGIFTYSIYFFYD